MTDKVADNYFVMRFLGGSSGAILVLFGFAFALAMDVYFSYKRGMNIDQKGIYGNIWSALLGVIFQPISGIIYISLYLFLYKNFRVFSFPTTVLSFMSIVLIWDLVHYCQHRLSHRVSILWAAHSVHHSAKTMDVSVAPRKFWLWMFGFEPIYLVLAPLGISVIQLAMVGVVTNLLSYMHHTRVIGKIPIFDLIFVTPSNHRVHHGTQVQYIDKNFAHVIILFDRVFGSYEPEADEPIYGDGSEKALISPLHFQFHGFVELSRKVRSAESAGEVLRYLLGPPGWEPARSRQSNANALSTVESAL